MFKIYWQALSGFRKKSVLMIILLGVSGSLEGIALMTLMPLLDMGLAFGKSSSFWVKWVQKLEFDSSQLIFFSLGTFIFFGVFSALVKFFAESCMLRLKAELEEFLRGRLTKALFEMNWASFLSLKLGDINKAVGLEGLNTSIGVHAFLQIFGNLLISIFLLSLTLSISIRMTIYTIVFGTLVGVGYRMLGLKADKYSKDLSNISTVIGNQATDVFGNLKFFRSTGITPQAENKVNTTYRKYSLAFFWSLVYGKMMLFVFEGGGVVYVGGLLAFSLLISKQPFAESLILLAVFYRLAPRIMLVHDSSYQARVYKSWFITWKERYDLAVSFKEISSGRKEVFFNRELVLKNVSFSYPRSEYSVINNVSFSIGRKDCVAIVGESGSGKSTLVDLITGLLKTQKGQIILDDIAISDLNVELWRSHIGLVLQESPLFHTTVLENIALGDRNPDREKAKRCAEWANALDFIEGLPNGFDTEVGEKGGRLSGGQKQRIALARALYREPWLLILDEATSALDSESEARIHEALEKLKGQFAILIVAHRLKTVQMADKILVLEAGKLAEQGKWQELITKPDGAFRRMAELQGLIN